MAFYLARPCPPLTGITRARDQSDREYMCIRTHGHLLLRTDVWRTRAHTLLTPPPASCPLLKVFGTQSLSVIVPGLGLGPDQRDLGSTKELKAPTSPAGKTPV